MILVRQPRNIHRALQGRGLFANRSSPYAPLLRWLRRRVAVPVIRLAASSRAKPPKQLVETKQLSSRRYRLKHIRSSPQSQMIPVSSICVPFAPGDPSPTSSLSGRSRAVHSQQSGNPDTFWTLLFPSQLRALAYAEYERERGAGTPWHS